MVWRHKYLGEVCRNHISQVNLVSNNVHVKFQPCRIFQQHHILLMCLVDLAVKCTIRFSRLGVAFSMSNFHRHDVHVASTIVIRSPLDTSADSKQPDLIDLLTTYY